MRATCCWEAHHGYACANDCPCRLARLAEMCWRLYAPDGTARGRFDSEQAAQECAVRMSVTMGNEDPETGAKRADPGMCHVLPEQSAVLWRSLARQGWRCEKMDTAP